MRIGAERTRWTMLRAIVVTLLAFGATLGLSAPAGAAANDNLIKVFVVKQPVGGQLATLQSIAADTLGNPSRSNEIFTLNRGQAQADGSALNNPADQLHPGWILRLPPDASGADVQLAKDNGSQTGAGTAAKSQTLYFTVPLAAALAVLGAILLALITAGIVGRRQVRKGLAVVGAQFRKLGEPAQRRRRLAERRLVGEQFAADADSVRRAYSALGEFAGAKPEKPVHALRVDRDGVTAWLTPSDAGAAPWVKLDSTRWRRPAGAPNFLNQGSDPAGPAAPAIEACLVRAGIDADGEPVFVDLSRLDGVLSVTGDQAVARQVVANLLAEIGRTRPNTMVTTLRDTDGGPPLAVPPGLAQTVQLPEPVPGSHEPVALRGSVRGAASRRPVKGLAVMAGAPTDREIAELSALCGPGGAGWTGLVCGEVAGAHWRWQTDADGKVDIPVLGVTLTVPA